jgi:hypothetical protein
LFELEYKAEFSIINANLYSVPLDTCPPYEALSYAWGDATKPKIIMVNGARKEVRESLWQFLHSMRSTRAIRGRYIWIDALCIDQDNIDERNEQVTMMKQIYQQATNVLVWLGPEGEGSDVAMDYLSKNGLDTLKPKNNGYCQMWSEAQGKAILALCERKYWRRIWTVREIIHAQSITVCCGRKTFPWAALENIYHNLKVIESKEWQRHHYFAALVLDSVACTTVWQRAYEPTDLSLGFRHLGTLHCNLRFNHLI